MEFWLIQDSEKLQLPVPPANYSVQESLNNSSVVVEGIGEVSFIGKPNLAVIPTISTFFPNHSYGFCQYADFPTPKECVDMIEKWILSGKPIRYLVTNVINLECTIENFEHLEQDGTGDVYFHLDLKEYKQITLATSTSPTTATTSKASVPTKQRSSKKAIPKTYTVKSGDTLSTIAKRLTGSASNYKAIATKNKLKNPNLIYAGQVLQI